MTERQRLRLAGRLHGVWQSRAGPDPSDGEWERLNLKFDRVERNRWRFELARSAELKLIQPDLRSELLAALVALDQQVNFLREHLYRQVEQDNPDSPLTLAHWFGELNQIEDEFDEVRVDISNGTVTVRTERIVFKEVGLGRFDMVFFWNRITSHSGSRCFDIVAVDSNPARGKDGVTHPHVRDEEVCAGDAGRSLEDAVREGRLCDSFLILRSVLTTYNSRSPYVPIEEWDGSSCSECGGSVDPDERSSCDACQAELCDGCIGRCTACEDYRCPSCLSRCQGCHNACCPGCLTTLNDKSYCADCIGPCLKCAAPTPKEDLSPDDELCPSCLETKESDETSSREASPPASSPLPDIPILAQT